MTDQDERKRRLVKGEQEEPKDDVEAHSKKALSEEPQADDESSDDVEAHAKKA
jgi:hypothetical protein